MMPDNRFEFLKFEYPEIWLSFTNGAAGAFRSNGKMKLPPTSALAQKFPDKVATQKEMDEHEANLAGKESGKIKDFESWVSKQIGSDEGSIRKDNFETAFIYTSDGNRIRVSQGKPDHVSFTDEQLDNMKDGVLTHNHPSGASFSAADIELFASGQLRSIRATAPGGGGFELKRKGMPKWMDTDDWEVRESRAKKAIEDADSRIFPTMQALVNNGYIDPDDAGILHNHFRSQMVAKSLDLSYSHNLTGSEKAKLERDENTFNRYKVLFNFNGV